jgi:uncharacterized membrane protein YjgN (DUF898 family)
LRLLFQGHANCLLDIVNVHGEVMGSGLTDAGQGSADKQEFQVRFAGDAREYFRIWIVNLCLTLLTLGVFSAWAKVRKQRYFYSHTVIDGTPLQYGAQPLPILKGRLFAAALFLTYYAAQYVAPDIVPYVIATLVVLVPWVIARSAAFRARYTGFRNITLGFHGNYAGAVEAVYWLGAIPFLVVGTMFEWWGDMRILGFAALAAGLLFPWWIARVRRFLITNTSFGGCRASFSATGWQYFKIYFVSGLIISLGGAITGVSFGLLKSNSQAMLYALVVPVYFFYAVAYAYVRAHTGNLMWNSSAFDNVSFRSTLKTRGLFALYLTNAIGILVSVGLLIPWAVIRTMRYRAENINVLLEGELLNFRSSPSSSVSAAGSELGEMFELELSL